MLTGNLGALESFERNFWTISAPYDHEPHSEPRIRKYSGGETTYAMVSMGTFQAIVALKICLYVFR